MTETKPLMGNITIADIEEIPLKYQKTLAMYLMGFRVKPSKNPNQGLGRQAYYAHKKELLKYGYDISNDNIKFLQPRTKTITLEYAGVPDWYEHAPKPPLSNYELEEIEHQRKINKAKNN